MSFDASVPLEQNQQNIRSSCPENDQMLSLIATPKPGPKGRNRVVKKISEFILSRLGVGLLTVAPIYLAALLFLKVMKSLTAIVRPLAKLLPKWLPAEHILSLLLVLIVCFLIGLMVRTPRGRATWKRMENSLLKRIPGYGLFRSLTQQLTGKAQDQAWKPALAEIEEALVPAFIIEEHEDGRFTVFVPSVPTPFAGAIYILTPDRVHPLDVPFTSALKAVSHWGSGTKDLVAAMERTKVLRAQ
jgi:uncharacterized membrane protein